MAGFNTVDTTGFDAAIAAFNQALQAYNDARDILSNRTSALAEDWEGRGGDKYRRASKKIFKLLEDDGESLKYIIQNLEEIRRAYAEADTKIAKDIENQDITASLGGGGGSTTHTSSSGRSHGGSGRSF